METVQLFDVEELQAERDAIIKIVNELKKVMIEIIELPENMRPQLRSVLLEIFNEILKGL